MAGPSTHGTRFVGRKDELRLLDEVLAAIRSGGHASIAFVGEPGIGKTALVGELATMAESTGFQVLRGRGAEFEQDVPFGLAIDALDRRFGELDADALQRIGEERVADLGAVFPSVAGAGWRMPGPALSGRFRSHRAVHAALEELAGTTPVVLVFDDLHWADPASLELVTHLIRHGVRATLVVAVLRASSPLMGTAFGRAVHDAGSPVLELGPLSVADLADAIDDVPDSPHILRAYEESGGNPLYFGELIRSGAGRPADAGVPRMIRSATQRELDALSASARLLAQAAAVAGEPFDADLVGAVAELAEADMLAALDELDAADLVHGTEVPGRLVFRHPIVRRAVYDTTGHGWRLGAHRRAAAALTSRGATIGARAHHVERSASTGDREAIALLTEAGRAAAAEAPSAAARWFSGALRLLPAASPPAERIALMLPLAAVHAAASNPGESRDTLERARTYVAEQDRDTDRLIVTQLAAAEQVLGRADRARALLEEALAEADPGSPEAVSLIVGKATIHTTVGEWREAVRVAAEAAGTARELGNRALEAAATATVSFALLNTNEAGSLERARLHTRHASAVYASLPDDELGPIHIPKLAWLAISESMFRDWAALEELTSRGMALAGEAGRSDAFGSFSLLLASAHAMRGDLARAVPLAEECVDAAYLSNSDQSIALTECVRCWVLAQKGRLADALSAGENAVRAAERAPHSMFWWQAHALHGAALIEAGLHEEGRRAMLRVGDPASTNVPAHRQYWNNILVRSYLATGDVDTAREIVEIMERSGTDPDQLPRPGEVRNARAGVLLATGHPEEAAEAALDAAACFAESGMSLEAARARTLAGRALVAAGSPGAGERELAAAHQMLTDRGAEGLAGQVAKDLRSLGHKVARLPGSAEALSEREREVATQVARGRTNRQVAEALFISQKTVEAHLARVYAKMGVTGRTAMVAAFARHRR